MVMVNAGVVNDESSYLFPVTFCVIFCDSGRFLDSRNPVKYSGNFPINLETVHFCSRLERAGLNIAMEINALAGN
jgi:hypothetical protein